MDSRDLRDQTGSARGLDTPLPGVYKGALRLISVSRILESPVTGCSCLFTG